MFLTQKTIFFFEKKIGKKKFLDSKTTVNPLRKKTLIRQTDLTTEILIFISLLVIKFKGLKESIVYPKI